MSKLLNYDDKVEIKAGHSKGQVGLITLVATINNKKRYYVKRPNGTIAWYDYHQLKRATP